jgi:hypothetical protein
MLKQLPVDKRDIDVEKGKADADREKGYIAATTANQQAAQDLYNNFNKHVDDYKDYLNNNPVDVDHYFKQMGVGQKIGSAFGVALSGVNGKGNPALDYIKGTNQ